MLALFFSFFFLIHSFWEKKKKMGSIIIASCSPPEKKKHKKSFVPLYFKMLCSDTAQRCSGRTKIFCFFLIPRIHAHIGMYYM